MEKPRLSSCILIVVLVFLADQLTKYLALTHLSAGSYPVIKGFFHLTFVKNTGALFGMFKGFNLVFILASIIVLGVIFYFFKSFDKTEAVLFSFVVAGVLGNLADRLIHGFVIDFFDFLIWPVFNIADIALSVSVVLLMVHYLKKK